MCNLTRFFTFGGVNYFVKLSKFDRKLLATFQNRAQKWQALVTLTSFHVSNLTAISLWVLVKVVYRDKVDVDDLEREDVERIDDTEICNPADPVDNEASKIQQYNQYPKWKKEMICYLEAQQTKENVRFSYVIHFATRPRDFDSLGHELEWVTPIDGSTAANKLSTASLATTSLIRQHDPGLSTTMVKLRTKVARDGSVLRTCVKVRTIMRAVFVICRIASVIKSTPAFPATMCLVSRHAFMKSTKVWSV